MKLRLLACAAILAVTALVGASVGAASTMFNSDDPTITVSAMLKSSGSDPEVARLGDTVYASVTMDSNVDTTNIVRVTVAGDLSGTRFEFDRSKVRRLRADGTWDWSAKTTIRSDTPPGVYHLTIRAFTVGSVALESVATATITVAG